MAKRDTLDHPKTHALAVLIDTSDWAALGLLSAFWAWAHKFAKHGALTEESFRAAAYSIRYEPGGEHLRDVLCEAGWVDRRRGKGYLIHDWPDHCEDMVHIKLARAIEVFACGALPRINRLNREEQERIKAAFELKSVRTRNARRAQQKRTTMACHAKPINKLGGSYNSVRDDLSDPERDQLDVEGQSRGMLNEDLREIQERLVREKGIRQKKSMNSAADFLAPGGTRGRK